EHQTGGGEQELDADEHEHQVAAGEHAVGARTGEHGRQQQRQGGPDHRPRSRPAEATASAATRAARSSRDSSSNGHTQVPKTAALMSLPDGPVTGTSCHPYAPSRTPPRSTVTPTATTPASTRCAGEASTGVTPERVSMSAKSTRT